MKIWICAVAKMEELYIREWIEWHKQLGIDHIIIADNNDSNYDKSLYNIIQDYIDEGFVEIINKQNVLNVQQPFYNEIYQIRKSEFDWISFIDIDEFIELPAYNNDIHLFLEDNKFNNIDAIILPWLNYGDNENLYYKNKHVKERFTKSIFKEITGIKYFIKSSNNIIKIVSFHQPDRAITINNYILKICDSLGNINFEKKFRNKIENKYSRIHINNEYYKNAYISHYITKSTEEYIKYKILRGRCDRKINNYDIRYTQNFYFNFNKHTEEKINLFNKYKDIINNEVNKQLKKYNMDI